MKFWFLKIKNKWFPCKKCKGYGLIWSTDVTILPLSIPPIICPKCKGRHKTHKELYYIQKSM